MPSHSDGYYDETAICDDVKLILVFSSSRNRVVMSESLRSISSIESVEEFFKGGVSHVSKQSHSTQRTETSSIYNMSVHDEEDEEESQSSDGSSTDVSLCESEEEQSQSEVEAEETETENRSVSSSIKRDNSHRVSEDGNEDEGDLDDEDGTCSSYSDDDDDDDDDSTKGDLFVPFPSLGTRSSSCPTFGIVDRTRSLVDKNKLYDHINNKNSKNKNATFERLDTIPDDDLYEPFPENPLRRDPSGMRYLFRADDGDDLEENDSQRFTFKRHQRRHSFSAFVSRAWKTTYTEDGEERPPFILEQVAKRESFTGLRSCAKTIHNVKSVLEEEEDILNLFAKAVFLVNL